MSAPASVEDVAEQLRIYAISDNIYALLCAAVAVTQFFWGRGYYCLCRQSNGMKVLMNQEGKRAKYAAARMYDGNIIDHLVTDFCKKVAAVEPRTSLNLVYRPGDNHVELDKRGVGMFCFAEHSTLFLVIIDPHDGAKQPIGITYERTLNLMAGARQDAMINFSVYSVPASSSNNADTAAAFAVDALKQHLSIVRTSLTAHELLTSHHFLATHRIPVRRVSGVPICIAASPSDFRMLSERFVDCRGEGRELTSALLVNYKDERSWHVNRGGVALIGGESGSGKTWEMLTNFYDQTDLTVYIRVNEVLKTCNAERFRKGTDGRNSEFCDLLAQAVVSAIDNVCKPLEERLRMMSTEEDDWRVSHTPFRVRICFDEIGDNPVLIRACCSEDTNGNMRRALGWAGWVEVRMFAAGTGLGTVNNASGRESGYFKRRVILGAPRGISLYWTCRLRLLKLQGTEGNNVDGATRRRCEELEGAVTRLCHCWSGPDDARAKALCTRDKLLWAAFAEDQSTRVSNRTARLPLSANCAAPGRLDLVTEAIFSAVESDGACVQALGNQQLAALMMAQCAIVAQRACDDGASVKTILTHIRSDVLQPVLRKFRRHNGLHDVTATEARLLLVESLRHAIFGGYCNVDGDEAAEYGANALMIHRGVLVDEAMFIDAFDSNKAVYVRVYDSERVAKMKRNSPYPYIACYRKDVGRYSISAAMVLVLSHLMYQ
ncbi:GPI-anchored surface protein, putative [Bodo saltans]|uniref:GPI-anchored surface protein, putative n=1 Tax=Bodo saltans TaxID=75058 RepID=A0A0S4J3Y1_BODSA|nr:GPI-anchored surface protein, putative [Bodo saltans]|eukprot:CUG85926.1 GPI-anchored surface protein, putative [Bodo saltans]